MGPADFPNLSKPSYMLDERLGVLRAPVLEGFLWLTHGVTTRKFAASEAETFELTAEVHRRLVPGASRVFCCEQVHESRIALVASSVGDDGANRIRREGPVAQLLGADALIVSEPSLAITIRTADCVPLLLVDVRRRRVAAVHAGWRGSLDRIAEKAIARMVRLGTAPADIVAWMGPTISRDRYEVGPELAGRFAAAFPDFDGIVADDHLDLVLLNACQLKTAGVPGSQIHAANCCTTGRPDLCFSYRAERDRAGRMVTYAMILPEGNYQI